MTDYCRLKSSWGLVRHITYYFQAFQQKHVKRSNIARPLAKINNIFLEFRLHEIVLGG